MSETVEKEQRPEGVQSATAATSERKTPRRKEMNNIEQLQINAQPAQTEKLDFEASISELEKVVSELDGEIKLDRALELFNRGMKLSSDCQRFLQVAEQQVELLKRAVDGSLSTLPFVDEDETND